MIGTVLSVLIGAIVVFPFVISFCLLILYRQVRRKPTMKKIADYTTPFLFLSVYVIAHTIFGEGVGFIMSVISLVLALGFAVHERRRVKDFNIVNLLRKVWRLFFIILLVVYFLLMITGLVLTIRTQFI